jgi:integrase
VHFTTKRSAAQFAGGTDLIFCTASGGPLEWRVVRNRYFKKLLEELGLPKIRGYDLRHTCATLLLEAGVNPVVIAERLGHKSTAFLLDTYAHVLPHQQAAASAALGGLLASSSHSDSAD